MPTSTSTLAAVIACALGGTLALAAQRSTEPEPAGPPARSRLATSSLHIPALRFLYTARFCTGGVFGAMPVATVAFTRPGTERPVTGGLCMAQPACWPGSGTACWPGGPRCTGGWSYRSRCSRPAGSRCLPPAAFPSSPPCCRWPTWRWPPATVSAMEVMQQVVPASVLTQAISWDTTSIGLGMTAGSFLAGAAAAVLGTGLGYLVPVGAGVLALGAVLAGRRRIRDACLEARSPAAPGRPLWTRVTSSLVGPPGCGHRRDL